MVSKDELINKIKKCLINFKTLTYIFQIQMIFIQIITTHLNLRCLPLNGLETNI